MTFNKDSKNWQRRAKPAGCQFHQWVLFYELLPWFIKPLWPQVLFPLKIEWRYLGRRICKVMMSMAKNLVYSDFVIWMHIMHAFTSVQYTCFTGDKTTTAVLRSKLTSHKVWVTGLLWSRETSVSTVIFTNILWEKDSDLQRRA